MMSHWTWRDVLPLLPVDEEQLDVIALDLPGFGESDRPAPHLFGYDAPSFAAVVDEVLGALGVDEAIVVGHSLGGAVALSLAARRPQRVSALVLISAAALPLPLPVEGRLLAAPVVGRLLWLSAVTRRDVKRMMLRDHFRDARVVTDAFVDYVWARLNRPGGREAAYAALQGLLRNDPARVEAEAVRAPTLLVWPEEDRVVPLAHGQTLAARIPTAAPLEIIPAAGHNVQLERPDELVRRMLPFMREALKRAGGDRAHLGEVA
jgi:pimeloyl-ACP methyl ester carboxylesterase